jgi:hypothetical protein
VRQVDFPLPLITDQTEKPGHQLFKVKQKDQTNAFAKIRFYFESHLKDAE